MAQGLGLGGRGCLEIGGDGTWILDVLFFWGGYTQETHKNAEQEGSLGVQVSS